MEKRREQYLLDDVTKVIVRLLHPTRILLTSSHEPVSTKRRYVRNHDIFVILLESLPDKLTEFDCMGRVYSALPPWPMDVDILVLTEKTANIKADTFLKSILEEGVRLYESESGDVRLAGEVVGR